MNDEPWSLFDALLGLSMEWRDLQRHYEDHRDALLVRLLGARDLPVDAYGAEVARVLSYQAAAQQLAKCIDGVDAELAMHEERRLTDVYNAPKPSTGPAAQSDG